MLIPEHCSGDLRTCGHFHLLCSLVFIHPVQAQEVTIWRLALHQGSQSVAAFVIEFRILVADRYWTDVVLQEVFIPGLSEEVMDKLATRDESDNLESLISLAIHFDNSIKQRHREKIG